MSNGRFRGYYWLLISTLAEQSDILALDSPQYHLSEPELAEEGRVVARIPFRDGSVLHIHFRLKHNGEVTEFDYAYVYEKVQGERVVQYDDNEHHSEIPTSPHHMHKGPKPRRKGEDRAWPLDIEFVSFEAVLRRIRERFFS